MYLFKYRLESVSNAERKAFMHENGLDFELVSEEEKLKKFDVLVSLSPSKAIVDKTIKMDFYKYDFFHLRLWKL